MPPHAAPLAVKGACMGLMRAFDAGFVSPCLVPPSHLVCMHFLIALSPCRDGAGTGTGQKCQAGCNPPPVPGPLSDHWGQVHTLPPLLPDRDSKHKVEITSTAGEARTP